MSQRLLAAPVTVLLFAACIALFVVAESNGSTQSTETLLRYGATWRGLVWKGEYWRLFTSMFLHIGVVHLVWNLYAGFSWTSPLERLLGPARFLLIYVASGLAGSAASVIGQDAVSAGASGALFGVIGGAIVLHRRAEGSWSGLWARPEQRRNLGMVALWLAIGPFMGFDSYAHAGGLLAGAALTWTLVPLNWGTLNAPLGAVALLVWISLRPIPGLHDEWLARERATSAYDRGDWLEVLAATELLPTHDNQMAWVRAGALLELDRAEEALPLLPRLTAPPPLLAEMRSRVHAGVAQYDQALSDLEPGMQAAPQNIELIRSQAWVLYQKGAYPKSEQALERLLTLAPFDVDARVLHARVLAARRRPEEALASILEARGGDPRLYATELVETYLLLGRYDEARMLIESSDFPANRRAWSTCHLEWAKGRLAAAEAACADPAKRELRELRAAIAAAKDDCPSAAAQLTKLPPTRFAQMISASCLIKEGGKKEASTLVDALLAPDPTDPAALLLFFALEESAEARAGLEGYENAMHSTVWPLLSAKTKESFARR